MYWTAPGFMMRCPVTGSSDVSHMVPRISGGDTVPMITGIYRGMSNSTQVTDYESDTDYHLNDDGLYTVYTGYGFSGNTLRSVNIMTPNVIPHILVSCMVGGVDTPVAIFEPTGTMFHGEQLWKLMAQRSGWTALRSSVEAGMDPNANWLTLPDSTRRNVWADLFSRGYFANMPYDFGGGTIENRLTWVNWLTESVLPAPGFQYPWDKADWKSEHAQEVQAFSDYWIQKSGDFYRGFQGNKWAFAVNAADAKCGTWCSGGYANGPTVAMSKYGEAYNFELEFRLTFFYPLIYRDDNGTGLYSRVGFSGTMPDFTELGTTFHADTRSTTGQGLPLSYDVTKAKATRRFGTPTWKVTFADFPENVFVPDPDMDYFVTFINDGILMKAGVTRDSDDQVLMRRIKRPKVSSGALLYCMPKEGDDKWRNAKVVEGWTVSLLQSAPVSGHGTWKMYSGLRFTLTAFSANYETATCPKRGESLAAEEVVPQGGEAVGGGISLTWSSNSIGPATQYYVEYLSDYSGQLVVDGITEQVGVFQVATIKTGSTH